MNKLTVSVVGGGAGGRLSLAAAACSEHYELVALADLRPEVGIELQETFPGLRFFANFREMFRDCPTDVVCVSTYPPSHEEVALAALNLPLKAILVEKPLGHSVASGRRILESVKRRNIPMATPHGLMVKRCPLEIIERTQNSITPNTSRAVDRVIEHLVELEHRRIAHITYTPARYVGATERLNAYRRALQRAQLEFDESLVSFGDFTIESGYHAMRKILGRRNRPTALFAGRIIQKFRTS